MEKHINIESISQINELLGYEKPKHPLVSLVDFSKAKFMNYEESFKLTTGLFSIFLKEHMGCELKYGRGHYDFEEGSLMFMAPQQTVIFDKSSGETEAKGWGLFFHPDLIRGTFLGEKIKEYTFFSYDSNEALQLSEMERETISAVVTKIEIEYSQNIDVYSKDVIISNLELLLSYSKRFYGRQFITRTQQNQELINKFNQLIDDYYELNKAQSMGIPSVKYCAEQLNFSPNYLTDLLKKETGKSTQEHIHLYLIDLAKTKLLKPDHSISEIAYDLGFEYPQYFSKMFKKNTGYTPAQYRNLN